MVNIQCLHNISLSGKSDVPIWIHGALKIEGTAVSKPFGENERKNTHAHAYVLARARKNTHAHAHTHIRMIMGNFYNTRYFFP